MRDIKFRARRKDNGQWVYGDYFRFYNGPKMNGENYSHFIMDHNKKYAIDPKTLGQYTGINDKNDTEIYKGMHARITMLDSFKNRFTLCEGRLEYVADDVASYGCGFSIVDEQGRKHLLSTIARSGTEIEVLEVEG